jgi:pimeloyl-ACP methyl ester carboxylesterase
MPRKKATSKSAQVEDLPEEVMREKLTSVVKSLKPRSGTYVRSRMQQVFQGAKLPKHLQQDLERLRGETNKKKNFMLADILRSWYNQRLPSVDKRQDCTEMISSTQDFSDPAMNAEVHSGAKMAMLAYALPGFFPFLCKRLHLPNLRFTRYMESMVAEQTFPAFEDMDRIVSGRESIVKLPDQTEVAGLYIRTKTRLWGKSGKREFRVPTWEHRDKLLQKMVVGNVNVYVLRMNYQSHFDLHVLFRGTSNEFNGIPQYGKALQNTQLFRMPTYSLESQAFVPAGSGTEPLFYFYYCQMLQDVAPHIYACLEQLGIESRSCRKVTVCGHSMGGGLTTTFAYQAKLERPKWWKKMFFRAYASPYSCNDAAVQQLEEWVVESDQPYKFIEVINTDDLVNVQYLFSNKEGLEESIKSGTASFAAWIMTQHDLLSAKGNTLMEKALRIMQLYPELALTTFVNGAAAGQIKMVPENKRVAFRLGQRHSEIKQWGSAALNRTYNRTLNVIFCKRRIEWDNEGLGRSHSSYIGINMNLFWSPLRAWENKMYRYYSTHTLRKHNELRVVGLFPPVDLPDIEPWLQQYDVAPWVPSPKLIRDTIRYQQQPAVAKACTKTTSATQ